jgi:hypothetical protein
MISHVIVEICLFTRDTKMFPFPETCERTYNVRMYM